MIFDLNTYSFEFLNIFEKFVEIKEPNTLLL